MSDLWRCALREVLRRKGRFIANILGYALAVAAIIVVVGLGAFSERAAGAVLHHVGTHFITFAPCDCLANAPNGVAENFDEGFVAGVTPTNLLPAALAKAAMDLPTVRDASPFLMYRMKRDADGQFFTFGGFDPKNTLAVAKNSCAAKDIVAGRFLKPGDKGVVVLEESFAQSRSLKPGDPLTIAGEKFTVAGVVNPGIRPAKADVYMPIAEARRIVARRQKGKHSEKALATPINMVLVEVASSQVQDEALAGVRKLYPGLLTSTYGCYRPARKVMGVNARGVALLTVVIGIGAVLLATRTQFSSVLERRREIGVLKAIGWADGDVVALVLAETTIQAALGAVLGCGVAVAALVLTPARAFGGAGFAQAAAGCAPLFPLAFALALAGGLLAGALPAWSAARLSPAEAMRRL